MTLASVLQLSFFAGLALSLVGKAVLPEPQAKFIEQNGMLILNGSFMCSMVAGNLLNTGAFEVSIMVSRSGRRWRRAASRRWRS